MRTARPAPFLPCLLLWLPTAALAVTDTSERHPCASILPPVERLACYDEAFGAPAEAAQSEATTAQARELFGLGQRETQERLPEQMRTPSVDEIEAAITRLSIDGRGGRVLTLENGQVWQITEVTSKGPLDEGDVVRIRKGAFGSFNLVTPAGVGLKARRVK